MLISHLTAHGFPQPLLDLWSREQGTRLLPLQERAVAMTGLLAGRNLLVVAPTSSGKSFVAELAALRHVLQGRRAVFLVPTKALAEEQFRRLQQRYQPHGLRVAIATRERSSHDDAIAAAAFDIAVMVYEKLASFLTLHPGLLPQIGLVALDELQILSDHDRGPLVDRLITRLARTRPGPQLVCLTAVVAETSRLASWLDCEVCVARERPRELREGSIDLQTGLFHYRESVTGAEGEEALFTPAHPPAADADTLDPDGALAGEWSPPPRDWDLDPALLVPLLQTLTADGATALLFVPTRHQSRQWAYQLAQLAPFDPATASIEELEQTEPCHARELLHQCLESGVAFHNADVPHELRRLVERGFQQGAIRVLVATSTLAQGVNLACSAAVSIPVMLETAPGGTPRWTALSRQRFRNQGGRAGRLSSATPFGRSLVPARNATEARRLFSTYALGDLEPLEPSPNPSALPLAALGVIHHHPAATNAKLRHELLASYTGLNVWAVRPAEFERLLTDTLNELAALQLIHRTAGGRYRMTALGEATAASGISLATAQFFAAIATQPLGGLPPIALLLAAALSDDGVQAPLPLTAREQQSRQYARLIEEHAELHSPSIAAALHELLLPPGGAPEALQAAAKKAFAAEAWAGPDPTELLEERFQVFSGTLALWAEQAAYLLRALAGIARALGQPPEATAAAESLATRLPDGLPSGAEALAVLRVPGLTRGFLHALAREGFDSPEALAASPARVWGRLLPNAAVPLLEETLAQLRAAASRPAAAAWLRQKVSRPPATSADAPPPTVEKNSTAATPLLRLDRASPGLAYWNGTEVFLPPLPFQLLHLLARHPRKTVPYALIDEHLWPEAKVEAQQILFHKRTIAKRLQPAAGAEAAKSLIRTVAGQGLYLDLDAADIHLGSG